jgi:integrase
LDDMEKRGEIAEAAAPSLPRTRVKLTDRYIQSRGAAASGARVDHYDSLVPGLALRVTDKAAKSFVLHGRFPRKPETYTRRSLGSYPTLSLDEARTKARVWQQLISRGIDPAVEEDRQRAAQRLLQVNTFAAVAAAFLAEGTKDWAKAGEAKTTIEREFVPRWRDRPITELGVQECGAAVKAIAARGAPYQAHNAFGYLRSLFNWAIASGCYGLQSSPLDRLRPKAVIGHAKALRTMVLDDLELNAVWQAAAAMGYPYGPLIHFLILTGQRADMVAGLVWREIDFDKQLWTVPADRMKGKKEERRTHEVPLCTHAITLLESLPRWNGGDHVFTTTNGVKPVNGFSKAKSRIDALIVGQGYKIRQWVFHDLRRTMRTHLSALPVQDMVRELVIAHTKKGLHRVYDQHAYQEEKRECMTLWEVRLNKILGLAR